jgi:tetratricopeptide (TPR) repeat protein
MAPNKNTEVINRMEISALKEKEVAANGGTARWRRYTVLGAVCALIIGLYAWSANSGAFESLESGARDSYYNLQVRGFRDGHLNVKRDAPPELAQFVNNEAWLDLHGLHDLSYYKGKLYLYFGVTPALVLFWPYAALTGRYLLHKDATALFFSAGFLAGVGLLWAVWRRYFKECGVWVVAAGTLALGLCNFAPAILGRCDVYEAAISCGYAFTMLALAGIWCALHDAQRRWRWLAASSLAYGLAVGARPSLLLGAVILLAPVIQGWREKGRVWPLLAAACGPIVLIGVGLMIYNAMRFDNPLEFGQGTQMPMTVHQQFRPRFVWYNFVVGFLEPARWTGHFPFVHDTALPVKPAGYWDVDHSFGVLTNIPLVWLGLAVPAGWKGRLEEERRMLRLFLGAVAVLFGMCALPLVFHDSMCLRYEVEYASPLVLLGVVGVFAVERALAGRPAWRRAARCGWVFLLAFAVAFNLLTSFELDADDHQNFGSALLSKGKVDEAIAQYQKALQISPDYALANNNLGSALLQKGRVNDAVALFQKALQIDPDYADAHVSLGNVLIHEGKVDEATAQFQKALQIEPNLAVAHNSLGNALLDKGNLEEAIAHFQRAMEIKPGVAIVHYSLAVALMRSGRVDEAITEFQKTLQSDPNFTPACYDLGAALQQTGRVGEAITQYQKALQLNPADPAIQNTLAWLLATAPEAPLRDGAKALELARQANQGTGGENPAILRTVAAACAEAGQFPEAVEAAQHALRLAQARSSTAQPGAQTNTALAGALQSELKLYQAGSPFHSPQKPP